MYGDEAEAGARRCRRHTLPHYKPNSMPNKGMKLKKKKKKKKTIPYRIVTDKF